MLEVEPENFSVRSKVENEDDGSENLYFEAGTATKQNCNQTNLYFEAGTLILGFVKLRKRVVN